MGHFSSEQNWALIDQWSALLPDVSWSAIDGFLAEAETVLADLRNRLRPLLSYWDATLAPLGGDPCRVDWKCFRPLRLGREEDWSDWLAHLLDTQTVNLAATLFGNDGDRVLSWCREDPTDDGRRRADLTIEWSANSHSHVEVKVGDSNYAKTFDTAACLERDRKGSWTHFILLREVDLEAWQNEADKPRHAAPRVDSRTWTEVAIRLREVLREGVGGPAMAGVGARILWGH